MAHLFLINTLNQDQENDQLKKNISDLKEEIENKQTEINERKAENVKLKEEIESNNITMESKMNDIEQYSRKHNIRISGLPETGPETAEVTTLKVVQKMNEVLPDLDLQPEHKDIAHRMGKHKKDRHRQIIVKFISRMKKDQILRKRKSFKGTDIFISEDLTPTNQLVLACIRRKMPGEVEQSWSKGGHLYYKLKSDLNTVIEVRNPGRDIFFLFFILFKQLIILFKQLIYLVISRYLSCYIKIIILL